MEPTVEDLRELKRILASGSTPYVEEYLKKEITRLEPMFAPKEEKTEPAPAPKPKEVGPEPHKFTPVPTYVVMDEKEKETVIIKNIRGLEEAEIKFEADEHGFFVEIYREKMNLPDLKLVINPTYKKIIPEKCRYRTKGIDLRIILKKKKDTMWPKLKKAVTKSAAAKQEEKKEEKEDPNAKLMGLMKKMYDEGDDEMKRTISKAMWEAQHKKEGDKKSDD